ncbi:MAG TPA: cysteine rich repeat-containing protein [Xanthobacteraceae bacterium]|jgi:hypothetical protein|nr:cysteine rich repeat-containing protein [Xanthobacteraceae bacterium]
MATARDILPLIRQRVSSTPLAAGVLILLGLASAQAQQPSPEQVSAIRSNCRSDFIANCSGVTPGGKEALECLKRNESKLSGACKSAVSAISPAPAAAEPAPAPAVSVPAAAPPPAAVAPKPAKPSAAAAAPATPATKPSAAQTNTIRAACRSDFMARCSGVTPGGAEALQCLKRNKAQLSGPCRSAIAAIDGGTTPASAGEPPVAAAPAAAPGFPPLGPPRPRLPRRAVMIVAICRMDAQTLCAGTDPGGERILSCLAAHGPQLSPECYKALAPVTQ